MSGVRSLGGSLPPRPLDAWRGGPARGPPAKTQNPFSRGSVRVLSSWPAARNTNLISQAD